MIGRRRTVVFLLSADHSGSTWVGYVLGSGRHSAFLGEYYRGWDEYLAQPCTICAERGLTECAVLHGTARETPERAHGFAFERTGARALIDSSKSRGWVSRFTAAPPGFRVRLVHVVRDPRGWFASLRRRTGEAAAQAMRDWQAENLAIEAFVQSTRQPCRRVFYDDLAMDPARAFRPLFAFCGMRFTHAALRYWTREHHCFAANGATSLTLREAPGAAGTAGKLPHFLTRDDAFYADRRHSMFSDTRWRTELSVETIREISEDATTIALLARYGKRMTPDGIVAVVRDAWRPWRRESPARAGWG